MIKEYWKIDSVEIHRYVLSENTIDIYIGPHGSEWWLSNKLLISKLNFSPLYFRSLEDAQDQLIRNLKRELEKTGKEMQDNKLIAGQHQKNWQELYQLILLRNEEIETLQANIKLRKECIERFHERAEKFEDKCEMLEKIVAGQKKIIDEKMSKNESLQDALKLVQGHAKNYYEENCNLRNCNDEYQKIFFDQQAKIAELEATLERIKIQVIKQTNKATKRGKK